MPNRKVGAATLAGALSFLVVWALNKYVGAELTGEAGSAITTILTFATGYVVTEPQ